MMIPHFKFGLAEVFADSEDNAKEILLKAEKYLGIYKTKKI